jgi:diguanylate cyclase (GGDEF)-like protein/PAS domain S-box-containing protein
MTVRPHAPPANIVDFLLDAVCMVDAQGCFVFVSAAFERIFGYAPHEVIGRPMLELVHPEDREGTLQAAREIMSGQSKTGFENRYVRKDGQVVYIMWSARWSEADQLRVAVARDITPRKMTELRQVALYAISEAAHSAQDMPSLFRRIHQIIDGLLPARNFFVASYDREHGELSFPYFVDERSPPPPPRALDAGLLSTQVIRGGKALLLTPDSPAQGDRIGMIDGKDASYWLAVPLAGAAGTIGALVVQSYSGGAQVQEHDRDLLHFVSTQVADAIERKRLQTRLEQIALYDPLTGLPNRPLLHDRLGTAMARARREHGLLAVLYLDLDGLKQVNDSLGHAAGDELLKVAAQRMTGCLRSSDTVARIGGDEFVVLLERIALADHAELVAGKLRAELMQPLAMEGAGLQIRASIGIAIFPQHGATQKALLQRADEAMYRAKKAGGDRVHTAPADADPGPA